MTWIFCKKNWSKTLIPAWNRSSNILLPPICSCHRLLCSMTKLKEHSREICYRRWWFNFHSYSASDWTKVTFFLVFRRSFVKSFFSFFPHNPLRLKRGRRAAARLETNILLLHLRFINISNIFSIFLSFISSNLIHLM